MLDIPLVNTRSIHFLKKHFLDIIVILSYRHDSLLFKSRSIIFILQRKKLISTNFFARLIYTALDKKVYNVTSF